MQRTKSYQKIGSGALVLFMVEQMDSECVEMDLSTRPRDELLDNNCKMRVAKSVFSIRSLVDVGDTKEMLLKKNSLSKGAYNNHYKLLKKKPKHRTIF